MNLLPLDLQKAIQKGHLLFAKLDFHFVRDLSRDHPRERIFLANFLSEIEHKENEPEQLLRWHIHLSGFETLNLDSDETARLHRLLAQLDLTILKLLFTPQYRRYWSKDIHHKNAKLAFFKSELEIIEIIKLSNQLPGLMAERQKQSSKDLEQKRAFESQRIQQVETNQRMRIEEYWDKTKFEIELRYRDNIERTDRLPPFQDMINLIQSESTWFSYLSSLTSLDSFVNDLVKKLNIRFFWTDNSGLNIEIMDQTGQEFSLSLEVKQGRYFLSIIKQYGMPIELSGAMGFSEPLAFKNRFFSFLEDEKIVVQSLRITSKTRSYWNANHIYYLFSEARTQELLSLFLGNPEFFGVATTCGGCGATLTNWISAFAYERGPTCGSHHYQVPTSGKILDEAIDRMISLVRAKSYAEYALFGVRSPLLWYRVSKIQIHIANAGFYLFEGDSRNSPQNSLLTSIGSRDEIRIAEDLMNWKSYEYPELATLAKTLILSKSKRS